MARLRAVARVVRAWLRPIVEFRPRRTVRGYAKLEADWKRYSALPGAERLQVRDALPMLYDDTGGTGFDSHYFYQGVWAFGHIHWKTLCFSDGNGGFGQPGYLYRPGEPV